MKKRLKICIGTGFALCCAGSPITHSQNFVVGVENTYYPPHYLVEEGQYRGYGREVLDRFFRDQGYSVSYRPLPVDRLYASFLDGDIDFKYPDNSAWKSQSKRPHAVYYSRPIAAYVDGTSVRPDTRLGDVSLLKTLGTVRGFTMSPWQEAIRDGRVEAIENDSFSGLIKQVLIGRIDGAYANTDVVQYVLEKVLNKPGQLVFDHRLPHAEGYYQLSTIKHPQVVQRLNTWLEVNEGTTAELKKAWGLDRAKGAAEPAYVIGVEDNRYLPYYSYENGEYIGFGREILDAFFNTRGHLYRYRPLPVARLFQSFVGGELDFKFPDNALWDKDLKRSVDVVYSQPVVASTDGVSVPAERVGRPLEQIRILGTVRGFTAWRWLDRIRSGAVVMSENDSTRRLVRQALMGRIDGAYANINVIQYILANQFDRPDALIFDPSLPHTTSAYFLSTIAHQHIILEFDEWLVSHTKTVADIKARYGLSGKDR